jgi:hypothetical protein
VARGCRRVSDGDVSITTVSAAPCHEVISSRTFTKMRRWLAQPTFRRDLVPPGVTGSEEGGPRRWIWIAIDVETWSTSTSESCERYHTDQQHAYVSERASGTARLARQRPDPQPSGHLDESMRRRSGNETLPPPRYSEPEGIAVVYTTNRPPRPPPVPIASELSGSAPDTSGVNIRGITWLERDRCRRVTPRTLGSLLERILARTGCGSRWSPAASRSRMTDRI